MASQRASASPTIGLLSVNGAGEPVGSFSVGGGPQAAAVASSSAAAAPRHGVPGRSARARNLLLDSLHVELFAIAVERAVPLRDSFGMPANGPQEIAEVILDD